MFVLFAPERDDQHDAAPSKGEKDKTEFHQHLRSTSVEE
jgi:hypothetical protein